METKVCNKCGEEKGVGEFYFNNRDQKYHYTCRACCSKRDKEKRKKQPKKMSEIKPKKVFIQPLLKICNKCNIEKDINEFYIIRKINEHQDNCKECEKKFVNERYVPKIRKPKPEISVKTCKQCGAEKDIDNFYYRKDQKRYVTICKECNYKNNKEYRENNKEEVRINKRKEYLKDREKILKRQNVIHQKRRKTDKAFRLKESISRRILGEIKAAKANLPTLKFLPYTMVELILYLESLFEPWMTWDNWGVYRVAEWDDNDSSTWKWNVDHIIPHSFFNYDSMDCEEFRKCWALENLRPYSAKQNIIDGNRRDRLLYIDSDNNEKLDRNVNAL